MDDSSGRYVKRTRLLINRGFQLRYMGVFVLSALLAALAIGGSLYAVLEMNWLLQVEKGLHILPETKSLLSQSKIVVLGTGIFVFLILSLILSWWGLYLSHRVAGPVYALSRFLTSMMSQKKIDRDIHFRKKDALQEVSLSMNETLRSLRKMYEDDIDRVHSISDRILELEKKYPQLVTF